MEKAPKDLIEFLAKARESGKYNMMMDAGEVIEKYVDQPATIEGLKYLYPDMKNLSGERYLDALKEMGKSIQR